MNQEQVLSITRAALQIIGTALVSKGIIGDADWTTVVGAVTMVVPVAWSLFAHSQQQQIANVAAMPEVKGIVTTASVARAAPSDKVVATTAEVPKEK